MICYKCNQNSVTRFKKIQICNTCYVRSYWEKHPEKFKFLRKKWREKYKFGRDREEVLERDGFKCFRCGISRQDHISKFGRDLSIHHIDGKGTNVKSHIRNNNIENLVTVCVSCHRKMEVQDNPEKSPKLPLGKWSRKYDKCIKCLLISSRYSGSGLCLKCSEMKRKEYKREWFKKKHPTWYLTPLNN